MGYQGGSLLIETGISPGMVPVHVRIEQEGDRLVANGSYRGLVFGADAVELVVDHEYIGLPHINPDIPTLPGKHVNIFGNRIHFNYNFLFLCVEQERS